MRRLSAILFSVAALLFAVHATAGSEPLQPEQKLRDAGIALAGGVAEVTLGDLSLTFSTDQRMGCFVVEDGGSDGAVSFKATDDAGRRFFADWAGDSPGSELVELSLPGGVEWSSMGAADPAVEVTVSGASAVLSATLAARDAETGSNTNERLSATITCYR
jgi:hypothetical protein